MVLFGKGCEQNFKPQRKSLMIETRLKDNLNFRQLTFCIYKGKRKINLIILNLNKKLNNKS